LEEFDYQLQNAIERADVRGCEDAIAAGASANARFAGGVPLLIGAVKSGNVDVVRALLRAGAEVDARNDFEETALMLSAEAASSQVEMAQLLIASGADVHLVNRNADTALHMAAGEGNCALCEVLVRAGANLDARRGDPDFGSFTPLHTAIWSSQDDAARALIKLGSDVNSRDAKGDTPAIAAAMSGRLGALKALALAGANLQAQNDSGVSPLHAALENKNVEAASFLMDSAGVAGVDLSGITALHLSVIHMPIEITSRIIEAGGDPSAVTTVQRATPLHFAASANRVDSCKLLLERGADPDAIAFAGDRSERRPFHSAVQASSVDVIAYFVLERGESLSQRTSDGKTLILLAGRDPDTIETLRSLETQLEIDGALDVAGSADRATAPSRSYSPI
jgi:ankyrin repeat protein